MPIRHVVLLKLKEETTDEQKDAMQEALMTLPAAIPEIQGFECGRDRGLAAGDAPQDVTMLGPRVSLQATLTTLSTPNSRTLNRTR